MSLGYLDFQKICTSLELDKLQDIYYLKYFEDIRAQNVTFFDVNTSEDKNALWKCYNSYRSIIRELQDKSEVNNYIDKLIDPHKVASCITLAILAPEVLPFKLKYHLMLAKDDKIISPIEHVGINVLLNEVFAFECGFKFLRYSIAYSHRQDAEMVSKIASLSYNMIPVNRYNHRSDTKYIQYVAYQLHHLRQSKSPAKELVRQNVLTLANMFHSIENYLYLAL